jgi:hypothetical protein
LDVFLLAPACAAYAVSSKLTDDYQPDTPQGRFVFNKCPVPLGGT